MINNEYRLRMNYKEMLKEKKELMVERMEKIKINSIQKYYQSLVKLEEDTKIEQPPLLLNDPSTQTLTTYSSLATTGRLSLKFFVTKNFKIQNKKTMNTTNSDLSQHIKTPVLITEKEKLEASPRKYKVKKKL